MAPLGISSQLRGSNAKSRLPKRRYASGESQVSALSTVRRGGEMCGGIRVVPVASHSMSGNIWRPSEAWNWAARQRAYLQAEGLNFCRREPICKRTLIHCRRRVLLQTEEGVIHTPKSRTAIYLDHDAAIFFFLLFSFLMVPAIKWDKEPKKLLKHKVHDEISLRVW